MGGEPLGERPFLPARRGTPSLSADAGARRGYSEMVKLLCRRRYRRRVLLGVWEPVRADAALRLERSVERLQQGLGRLGLTGIRLRDGPLRSAAATFGWGGSRAD